MEAAGQWGARSQPRSGGGGFQQERPRAAIPTAAAWTPGPSPPWGLPVHSGPASTLCDNQPCLLVMPSVSAGSPQGESLPSGGTPPSWCSTEPPATSLTMEGGGPVASHAPWCGESTPHPLVLSPGSSGPRREACARPHAGGSGPEAERVQAERGRGLWGQAAGSGREWAGPGRALGLSPVGGKGA